MIQAFSATSSGSRLFRLRHVWVTSIVNTLCMAYQHRQHPCFPTSCHLQRRHHRQQTANRFKWSRCWEVAVL